MTQKQLNAVGLILGIVGVVVMFKWGPPQPNLDSEVHIVTSERHEATDRELRVYIVMSRIGLGLVGIGFLCQFVALFLKDSRGPIQVSERATGEPVQMLAEVPPLGPLPKIEEALPAKQESKPSEATPIPEEPAR